MHPCHHLLIPMASQHRTAVANLGQIRHMEGS